MTSNEPTDVGPAAGGHLPAGEADRQQVISLLNAAVAEGRITVDEHRGRVGAAAQAQVFDDLIPLTRDLMPSQPVQRYVSPAPASPAATIEVDPTDANPETDAMISVFGATTRTGRWRVRRSSFIFCLFGGVELDLRDAVFEAPTAQVTVLCVFGGIDIKAPHGMRVDNNVVGIFGGSEVRHLDQDPAGPALLTRGLCLFGGLEVKGERRTSQQAMARAERREQARRARAERREEARGRRGTP